jgi:hypothetical protein
LVRGLSGSCGCYQRQRKSESHRTHGAYGSQAMRGSLTSWRNMLERCRRKKNNRFHVYGGRGIKVCERWLDFQNFWDDMGLRPDGMSLDRVNSDGNYEPSNCRWATCKTQQNNRRNNRMVTVSGITKTASQWSDHVGISYAVIHARLQSGWSDERAVSTPVRKFKT